jgi:hypothetical protein
MPITIMMIATTGTMLAEKLLGNKVPTLLSRMA